MDRYFKKQNMSVQDISVLDRLAYLGHDTMGALTYEPAVKKEYESILDLAILAKESHKIDIGATEDVLAELYVAGGSPGGARPKVCVGLKNDLVSVMPGDVYDEFEPWIIKFPAHSDNKQMGIVEYVYSLLAKEAGLEMTETKLFNVKGVGQFFGIKRFDRAFTGRIHTHTFANLIHADFRVPNTSYETFLKVTYDLTKSYQELLKAFRLMCFNVIFNNRDDHIKNFSYLLHDDGNWHLSPAYDLCYSRGMGGEHFMTIQGEGNHISDEHINKVAKKVGIKQSHVKQIIRQIIEAAKQRNKLADNFDLNKKTKKEIADQI